MDKKVMSLVENCKKTLIEMNSVFLKILDSLSVLHKKISLEKFQNAFYNECTVLAAIIAGMDGKITEDEIFFINYLFGTNFSVRNIVDLANRFDLDDLTAKVSPTVQLSVTADCEAMLFGAASKGDIVTSKAIINFIEALCVTSLMFDTSYSWRKYFFRYINTQLTYINSNDRGLIENLKPMWDTEGIESCRKYYQITKSSQTINQAIVNSNPKKFENTIAQNKGRNFDTIMQDLTDLVGLNDIKTDVKQLINLVKVQKMRREQGLKTVPMSLHLVFTGNPGTGKTTVARLLAELYKEIGVLKKGQLIEVDRSELVAGYVGQTAIKTQEKINEALGGILFIDEAYTLVKEGNDYGQEAIDTLLKEMEDKRDEFIVIVAGYEEPMKKFIESNPGLKSRFNKYFHFPNYTSLELIEIFERLCTQYEYLVTPEAKLIIEQKINALMTCAGENFANGREVRNYFENLITNQANRTVLIDNPSKNDMITITVEDVQL